MRQIKMQVNEVIKVIEYPQERTEENDPCPFRIEKTERNIHEHEDCVFFPHRLCTMTDGREKKNR